MNILREFRHAAKKSIATRIRLVLLFSVILIVNTYAWWSATKDIKLSSLEGEVTSWDVAYYVEEDEVLDQTAEFKIDELYPGMPDREDTVHIYNIGTTGSNIKYELMSVKVFGQEILDELKESGSIVTDGNTTNIFANNSQYPFNISYTYDKAKLSGKYADDYSTPGAVATFKYNVNWSYQEGNTETEQQERDSLDTIFGKSAYQYYQNPLNDPSKAIEIYVKITSSINRDDKQTSGEGSTIMQSVDLTTNKINVQIGELANYAYYIKESADPNDTVEWTKVTETSAENYTYRNLKNGTDYCIKIAKLDENGAEGESEKRYVKTRALPSNLASDSITLVSKTGADGEGVITLELDEDYVGDGYNIEWLVLGEDEIFDVARTWTKSDKITGLCEGQKIYARVTDGINISDDYYELVVEGLERFEYYVTADGKSSENTTVQYTDSDGNTAWIPAGFKVGVTDIVSKVNDGLVIQDADGNEFVWVQVPNVIETNTSTSSSEKAMARLQSGSTKYYEGVLYNFSGTSSTKQRTTTLGQSSYREPSLLTGGEDYTWNVGIGQAKQNSYDTLSGYYKNFSLGSSVTVFNSYTEFGQYMNEQYTNMVNSVNNYKGFYVGRYETSTVNSTVGANAVVQSKRNVYPLYDQAWYKTYYYQDSNINSKNPYYSSSSVTSSMIWGSQWDAMLNWMLQDDNTKNFVTSVAGNRTGTRVESGQYEDDKSKNIYDLSANVVENTQEAFGSYGREYRGGSFLKTSDKYGKYTAGSRYSDWATPFENYIQTNPTNSGNNSTIAARGTRMQLFIKNSDTTAPIIDESNTTVTKETNSVTISLDTKDTESGIKKYKYTLSLKDFKAEDFADAYIVKTVESYGWTHQFTGLDQSTPYYIKAEVTNNVGLTSTYYSSVIQTNVLNVTADPSTVSKVYGKSKEMDSIGGYAYLTLDDEYQSQNYKIQYQILAEGQMPTDSGWKNGVTVSGLKGCLINGLSTNDVIYTRITDGNNTANVSYKTLTVTELETYSDVQTSNYTLTDSEGNTAVIPAGFKYGTSSINGVISNGLVIEDEGGNQFVWIPVENAIYDGKTTLAQSGNSSTYKPFARYQKGYSASSSTKYYEGILYNYSGTRSYVQRTSYALGTTNLREPSLVTGNANQKDWKYTAGSYDAYDGTQYTQLSGLGIDSPTAMGEYMNNQYANIVESVAKYGGFYVGRYETSTWTNATATSNADNTGTIAKSKASATPMARVNWYKMYMVQDSNYADNPYHSSTSVSSSMIWGSQYDAVLNYILEGNDKSKVNATTGNHSGSRAATGKYPSDIMNNIFDLSSNVREWTPEANGIQNRVLRGGYYGTASTIAASRSSNTAPTNTYNVHGSRFTLYLK